MRNPLAMQETGFDPWVWKIPGGASISTPAFLPGEPLGQRSLGATVTKSQTGLKQLTDTHVCVKIESIWTKRARERNHFYKRLHKRDTAIERNV